ncbi:MAG TPA: tripartite tricarboxylate transporter substrate binding protein [Burkholderiales bacterium]|nr:tripartite tricarboxylate transporter substrate binding protein [Burkholderiales bacterium]
MLSSTRCAAAALALAASTLCIAAEQYPSRPIRFLVPSAPGGTPDVISRVIGAELAKQMGQQVVVDNRAGANGGIGMFLLARASPDGYTIGYGPVSAVVLNPVFTKVQYDPEKDIQPVVQLVYGMHILTVSPTLPVKSVQELIDHAKANPNKLSFGSPGSGSSQHLGMELFKLMTGVQMVHVPYKAIALATNDVMAGRLQATFDNLASMLPHVRAGRVRGLGVTAPKRTPAAPELPSISETVPGFEVITWSSVVVPSRVPKAIVARLNVEVNKALASEAAKERLAGAGYELPGGSVEHIEQLVKSERVKWAGVVKKTGAKPD